MKPLIAVTGSHGFVGKAFLSFAEQKEARLQAIARADYLNDSAYAGCETVVHLAGLAHRKSATLDDFMAVNCELAVNAARAAKRAGAKQFIYVSSSKALRDFGDTPRALDELTTSSPACDYGRSKLAAETKLLAFGVREKINIVVIRPALVVGAPAKANLKTLANAARWSGIVPGGKILGCWILSAFQAPKSFTSLENLCSALLEVANSNLQINGIFNVVDDQPMSTSELFNRFAMPRDAHLGVKPAMGNPYQACDSNFLALTIKAALTLIGLKSTWNALGRPFVLDGTKIQRELGWKPKPLIDAELQRIMANLPISEDGPKG
jgi:nucleoside-diphosphate-sugar epimerase